MVHPQSLGWYNGGMDLPAYICFGQELIKRAGSIPREYGGGSARAGRRPYRASTLLKKTSPKSGFPPAKEEDPNSEDALSQNAGSTRRSDYMPAAMVLGSV